MRAVRQSHPDVPIFALSQQSDNTNGVIKGDLYGGALQDWLKLPVDASEVIARVEGALRHQVCLFHAGYTAAWVPVILWDALTCYVDLQYRVVKKLRNEVLALKADIDTLQRLQQENHQPDRLVSQQSM